MNAESLVEIDRKKVINMGGSRYVGIPGAIRDQLQIEIGDEVIFLRSPNSSDVVIRIEKQTPEKGSEHTA